MPSSALSGRDPQNGKIGFSRTQGFTIIELMIVVAVLAIAMSLALPSYRTLIEKRQVTSGAEQIAAFVSSAQLEAVKRDEIVAVNYVYTGPGDWCIGMVAGAETCACVFDPVLNAVNETDTTCRVDDSVRAFSPANLNYEEALEAIAGDDAFAFEPTRGLMVDLEESVTFQLLSYPENTYALNVTVGPTGRVRICSDVGRSASGDREVPGFAPCQ